MIFVKLYLINTIVFGTLVGFNTRNIFFKKGRDPKNGFLLGFFLHVLGLIISLSLSSKNEYKPKSSRTKRVLLGIGRFFIFSIINQIIFTETLDQSDLLMTLGPLIYSWMKYGFLVIGTIWVLRGNYNFFNLSIEK